MTKGTPAGVPFAFLDMNVGANCVRPLYTAYVNEKTGEHSSPLHSAVQLFYEKFVGTVVLDGPRVCLQRRLIRCSKGRRRRRPLRAEFALMWLICPCSRTECGTDRRGRPSLRGRRIWGWGHVRADKGTVLSPTDKGSAQPPLPLSDREAVPVVCVCKTLGLCEIT